MNWIRLTSLICLLFTGSAVADSRPQLQISVGDWPPYLSSELKHDGVIAHLISDVFADEGYRVSFRFLPWPRAYADAAAGKFDASAVWMHKLNYRKWQIMKKINKIAGKELVADMYIVLLPDGEEMGE